MLPFIRDHKVYVPILPTPTDGQGTIGDAMRELKPDEPEYAAIKADLKEKTPAYETTNLGRGNLK
jgi:hypothetical protein